MPIAIELSVVDDPEGTSVPNMGQHEFAAANTSTTWQMMNV
jgi:hypothetical protein